MIVVLTTASDPVEASALAQAIVGARLAACVQIIPSITSVYFWEGSVRAEPENLLLIKTLKESYAELEAFIRAHHSYDVPEIVALDSKDVSAPYLKWVTETVNG